MNKIKKNFFDLTNIKYHGIEPAVLDKIQEALKLDFIDIEKKQAIKKSEDDDSHMIDVDEMRHGPVMMSAIK